MADWFIQYPFNALNLSIAELLWTFGLSIAIAVIMSFISKFIYKHLWLEYGHKGVMALIYTTAFGTMIHELSHALFCLIFNHKITNISLFHPTSDGTLGYVEHAYIRGNAYQSAGNFFIGIAPVIMSGVITYLLTIWLVPNIIQPLIETHSIRSILLFVLQIYHNLLVGYNFADWHFWVYIVLIFVIAGHSTLSGSDMKGAVSGIIALVTIVFVGNCLTIWMAGMLSMEFNFLIRFYAVFYANMLFGLSLYVGLMGILLTVKLIAQPLKKKNR